MSSGSLVFEDSRISGTSDGIQISGTSHIAVVASQIVGPGSCGIRCTGDAVCFLQSSVVQGSYQHGILCSGVDGPNHTQLQLRNTRVDQHIQDGIVLARAAAEVANSLVGSNGHMGICAVASSLNVRRSAITDNMAAAISVVESQLRVQDCDLGQDVGNNQAGNITVMVNMCETQPLSWNPKIVLLNSWLCFRVRHFMVLLSGSY